MKFTLAWLKDHLDTNATLDEISTKLTAIGLEVENILDRSRELAPFTVAKILHAEKHPEADKLRVCRVQSDVGELQIVCGAPNARTGLTVALAKEGAVIPVNGMVIKKTKIRGVESNGMLCSAEELAIGGDSTGIIELPDSAAIGESVAMVMGLNDPVIEIAITPNRADCLGVRGIARDLAAAGLGTLKPLAENGQPSSGKDASPISVTITPNTPCSLFIGVSIKGVRNGESPVWLKQRLETIGLRPISALVDITNYFTFDLGRPLHVYDQHKLSGNLTIRRCTPNETLEALNGKSYVLASDTCVIADQASVVGIGGIIGGTASGCTDTTTDVFLEVAIFDPVAVAKAGRALMIDSDARYRFERHVDPAFAMTGAQLATNMIVELCGGVASAPFVTGSTSVKPRNFNLRQQRVLSLGGVPLENSRIEQILSSLGFTLQKHPEGWQVDVPSWRNDIEGEADLIEEILRIHGYDRLPVTPLPKLASISKPAINSVQKRTMLAKRALASQGLMETCTWSFISKPHAQRFGGGNEVLALINPISADLSDMRPSLFPNLLDAVRHNMNRGLHNVGLFEVGLQFHDMTPQGQRMVAVGVSSGQHPSPTYSDALYQGAMRSVDVFDAKSYAITLLEALGMSMNSLSITSPAPDAYHPGRSGTLTLGGKIVLGHFGELHPALLGSFDIDQATCGFEIFLDAIPLPRAKSKARPALKRSEFQPVERDFAFSVDASVTAATIIKSLANTDKTLISSVGIFDVYAGKGVDAGKKSVAVKVTLQPTERTLTEQDINDISQRIIKAAAEGFGGHLRQ